MGSTLLDPGARSAPYESWAVLMALLAVFAVATTLGILGYGVATSLELTATPAAHSRPSGPGTPWHAAGARRSLMLAKPASAARPCAAASAPRATRTPRSSLRQRMRVQPL